MHSIPSQENTFVRRELRAYSLSDAICSPPVAVLIAQLIRSKDLIRCLGQIFRADLKAVNLSCVLAAIVRGLGHKAFRTALPFSSTSVTWMYSLTYLSSLGMTIMLPDAEWMAQRYLISAVSQS